QTWWRWVAVGIPKSLAGRHWDGETFNFDVVDRVAGIGELRASGTTQAIRECPVIATQGVLRIRPSAPSCGKRSAVTRSKDQPKFPTSQSPLRRRGQRLRSWRFPRSVNDKCATHVEIREPAAESHIKPVQARDRVAE